MGLVERLRLEREGSTSVAHQFRISYKPRTKDIYVFFEGRDDSLLYMPEIKRRYKKGSVTSIICNGKQGVIDAYTDVKGIVNNTRRIWFFVDKDLDDFLGRFGVKVPRSKSFYITHCYSIENEFVCNESISYIWEHVWGQDAGDERLQQLLDSFAIARNDYNKIMITLMSWVICQRLNSKRPLLNNINLKKYIAIDNDCRVSKKKKMYKGIDKSCGINERSSIWKSILPIYKKLKTKEPCEYIRGKYELWFFVIFINKFFKKFC